MLSSSNTSLNWNLAHDVSQMFSYAFMRHAYEAGTVVAIVAGVTGYFVVLRGSAFAAHALSHIGFSGATGAVLIGVSPVFGLTAFATGAAVVMGALGQRLRGRDTVIGIVMAFSLALGVLFLSLYTGYATEAYALLFGEILGISVRDVVITLVAGCIALTAVAVMYRPLLFASIDEEVAQARRIPVRGLSVAFMVTLALTVAAAVQVVGVLLVFSLAVTPPATAQRLTARPGHSIALSVGLALAFTWIGLAVGFYSPHPVSFFITSFAFATYIAVRFIPGMRTLSLRIGKTIGPRKAQTRRPPKAHTA